MRSVLETALMALADAFDKAYIIKYDLQMLFNKQIPLTFYTDSMSICDVMTKASTTPEKRFMIDLKSVKNAYRDM